LENFRRKFANLVALPTDVPTNHSERCKAHQTLLKTDRENNVQIDA